jgi:hypothetical protein
MTTMHRRRQWRDKRHQPTSLEDLHMSNQYIGVLCALAGIGTALVIPLLFLGQPFVNLIFGFMP